MLVLMILGVAGMVGCGDDPTFAAWTTAFGGKDPQVVCRAADRGFLEDYGLASLVPTAKGPRVGGANGDTEISCNWTGTLRLKLQASQYPSPAAVKKDMEQAVETLKASIPAGGELRDFETSETGIRGSMTATVNGKRRAAPFCGVSDGNRVVTATLLIDSSTISGKLPALPDIGGMCDFADGVLESLSA